MCRGWRFRSSPKRRGRRSGSSLEYEVLLDAGEGEKLLQGPADPEVFFDDDLANAKCLGGSGIKFPALPGCEGKD